MLVTLDKEPCTFEASCIGDALGGAAALLEQRGRVIVEVIVDGDPWDEDQLGSADARASAARHVELVSADLMSLVRQTLTDASEGLLEADRLQRHCAELIQRDCEPQAMDDLGKALAIWHSVQNAVTICGEALAIDLNEVRVADKPLAACVQRLDGQLHAMLAALEAKDTTGLADMLLYELPDVVVEWRELLDTLRQRSEERP